LFSNHLISSLGINIPSSVRNNLTKEYDLFFLSEATNGDRTGPRLGLALETNSSANLDQALTNWEQTIVQDLTPLILDTPVVTGSNFLSANYKGINIRYRNLPVDSITIDYAHTAGTLIITTSKDSMFRAIDALR